MTTSRKRPIKSDKINLTPEPMKWESRVGLAMILAMIISGLAIGVSAAGIYAATTAPAKTVVKKLPKLKKVVIPKASPKTSVQKQLDAIKVNLPTLGVSASPIPKLNLAPLNLAIPKVPAKNVMKGFGVDKKISYDEPVTVAMPDMSGMIQSGLGGAQTGAPAGTPTTGQPSTTPTATTSTAPPAGGSNASTPTAANCAQFSGVPSCSYIGDTNGQALCNSCRAAGM